VPRDRPGAGHGRRPGRLRHPCGQPPVIREGGRAGSIVELAGDLEPAVNRNITLHGVLVRPSRAVLGVLAAAVAGGSLRR
jgi:hypothetical protein